MTIIKKPSLGKGLAALLGETAEEEHKGPSSIQEISINQILPNKEQPRKQFNKDELQQLAESIKQKGVLQPILVRPHSIFKNKFEIIAGERRWRAATIASLETVPAIIRPLDNQESLEIALIENIQRQDLHVLEEAESYEKLTASYHYTQEDLAKVLGKSRSYIANILRLNSLSDSVKEKLRNNQITTGHARALINCENPETMLDTIINENYNVRQTEDLIRQQRPLASKKQVIREKVEKNPDIMVVERQLQELLNMPVRIEIRENNGTVMIKFQNLLELDRLITRIDTLAA